MPLPLAMMFGWRLRIIMMDVNRYLCILVLKYYELIVRLV